MEKVYEKLQAIGLSEKESRLYIAGLIAGPSSAQSLGKLTDIKRSSVYHLVEGLVRKGVAYERSTFEGMRVVMQQPQDLKNVIETERRALGEKERLLEELLPDLIGIGLPEKRDQVDVRQFEGIESVKVAVDDALYCKSRKWDIIAPRGNFFDDFDEGYKKYYISTRQERDMVNRTLWEDKEREEIDDGKDVAWRNPRILPGVMNDTFKSILILYDNKVLMISSYDVRSAVIITSQEFHDFMTALFEGLWASAPILKKKTSETKENVA